MIIPGKTALARGIITGLRDHKLQTQPCGVDLSLRHIMRWSTSGTIDFTNRFRVTAKTDIIPFTGTPPQLHLDRADYLVQFNETVDVPLNPVGQVFVRSSLWRSGVNVSAGVMDSGYKGVVGAMLQVVNPHGITLHERARLAQMVFHEMSEDVEGYDGVYQGAVGLAGL
ncbi:hypothetical protein B0A55_04155 [Friedmanniomyces simplex]|uniref:Uncharacterized protein n=1 Tax=Friedmanniomyces simplex TaxID=329884 RepID=A0A4U0XRF9_9PEZI|nr:hypothetical protein B0A55_04155 [Friedmanniomyces simplex]